MRRLIAAAMLLGCQTTIHRELDEAQANEVQTALIERGLTARKVREDGRKGTWAIEVPDEHAIEAVRVSSQLGLPHRRPEGFREVFGKGGLVPSQTEERALYVEALCGEIARTLESMDGVISARVHLVTGLPARPGGAPPVAAKASALVRVRPGKAAARALVRDQIQALIAGAVEGLAPQEVALMIEEAPGLATPPVPTSPQRWNARTALSACGWVVAALSIALTSRSRRPLSTRAPA